MSFDFDQRAATWDDDPKRVRAKSIANHMRSALDFSSFSNALEYGSGTGLLSFCLKDDLLRVTLMDASKEMTEVAKEKCRKQNVAHLHPVHGDLLSETEIDQKFDLVFSLMVLHHIEDINALLQAFHDRMIEGGKLAIMDLEEEDGSFHDDEFHGHHGFARAKLEDQLTLAGFDPEYYEVCYTINKGDPGNERHYPLFLLIAEDRKTKIPD